MDVSGRAYLDHNRIPSPTRAHELPSGQRDALCRTRYRLSMAGRRRRQDRDAISRLADAGEDALRRLVDLPRRAIVSVMDRVDERVHDVTTRLRAADPLAGRVEMLEKRLDSLEKPKKTAARRASTRAKASAPRRADAATTLAEPEQIEYDRGRRGEVERKDRPE